MFPVVTLLLSKTTSDQDFALFFFSSFLPTRYFGEGSITTYANILFVQAAISHTWRRNTDDSFVSVTGHTPLYVGHGSRYGQREYQGCSPT